tara:strand:+ start:452 stop:655 length:204 start_codon:yes stop_codon:yes gene_type:complete
MTVKELIKELNKYPEDLDVRFYTGKWEQLIQTVEPFIEDRANPDGTITKVILGRGTGKGVVFLEGDF